MVVPRQARRLAEGALAGTYIFRSTYFADGSLASTIFPAAGGLSGESVLYGYDSSLGLPSTMGPLNSS